MRTRTFLLAAALFFLVVAVVAAAAGGIEWAIPIALVALIVMGYALVNKGLEQRELSTHGGDPNEALRDASDGGLPKAHVIGDEETALGDTPEVHSEVSPHDYPKGTPGREAADRMAEERRRT